MKTAVNWLVDHLYLVIPNEERNFLEGMRKEALDKVKEQIMNDYRAGVNAGIVYCNGEVFITKEEYYNQTYKPETI